jgi:hypothetical protein
MGYFLIGLMLVVIIILAAPLSLGYDSLEKWLKVRWLGLTITRRIGREKPKKFSKRAVGKKKTGAPLTMRPLWQQRDLVRELIQKLVGFALELGRTLTFRDSEARISLPDPMWNGMLYAVIRNINVQDVNLSVNFEQRNYAKIWVTLYPYRILQKLAVFLFHFPYRRTIRLAWDLKKQHRTG